MTKITDVNDAGKPEYEWKVQPDRNDHEMYEVAGGYLVAGNLPLEDAKLIAAAPKLLKVLRQMVQAATYGTFAHSDSYPLPMARAAIKAADGE